MPTSILDDPKRKEKLLSMLADAKKGEVQNQFDAEALFEKITERVIGQDPIVRRITEKIDEASYLKNRDKPIISILISGPSGTGKTELAKSLADAVFGEDDKYLYRLDCGGQGSSEADMAAVTGSVGVYTGSSRGSLPDYLLAKKKGVLLFDEIEKAVTSPDAPLAKMMLSLLDEGRVQSKYDSTVHSAKDCIVVMTSNAIQEELAKLMAETSLETLEDQEALEVSVKELLLRDKIFAPEFLNRIDLVTSVQPLNDEALLGISGKVFFSIMEGYGIEPDISDASCNFFFVEAAQTLENTDARSLERWMRTRIKSGLAEYRKAGGGDTAKIKVKGDAVTLHPVKSK